MPTMSADQGVALYLRVCEMDLEGIVAKLKTAPYLFEHSITTWYKIKNPHYSQMEGVTNYLSAGVTTSQLRAGIAVNWLGRNWSN
jgi:ATP-dependent DNA ligase